MTTKACRARQARSADRRVVHQAARQEVHPAGHLVGRREAVARALAAPVAVASPKAWVTKTT